MGQTTCLKEDSQLDIIENITFHQRYKVIRPDYKKETQDSHVTNANINNGELDNKNSLDEPSPQFAEQAYQKPLLPQPVEKRMDQLGPYQFQESNPRGTALPADYALKNGIIYSGQWKQGKIHGRGKYILQDYSYLQATTVENQITGQGRLINSNGDYYEGYFINNKAEGLGKYVEGKTVYTGYFKDNLPHGEGTEIGQNFKFKGIFKNGQKANGKLSWKDEYDTHQYEGDFTKNMFTGNGLLKDSRGIFQSQFSNGKRIGQVSVIEDNYH